MRYEYINGRTFEFGGQGFNAGLVSRFGGGTPDKFRLDLEVLADFMPIAAVRSDYYETEEGRDYDYGLGLGGWLEARAVWPGKALLRYPGPDALAADPVRLQRSHHPGLHHARGPVLPERADRRRRHRDLLHPQQRLR